MPAGDVSKALKSRVRSRTGLRTEQGLLDVHIYAFLNRAQHHLMWRLHDQAMPEMSEIATGTLTNSRVALPADFMRDRTVLVGADDIQARRIGPADLSALSRDTLMVASATNPYYWIWYNVTDGARRLMVEIGAPTSTAAYDLYYIKLPTDMSDSTDPILGSDKYNMLVDYAVRRVLQMVEEEQEAANVWERYIQSIRGINSRYRHGGTRQEHEAGAPPTR